MSETGRSHVGTHEYEQKGSSIDDRRLQAGVTPEESAATWDIDARAPQAAPNVVVVILDDVGFAQLGCYGSDIHTPSIDALATGGVRYNNFHVTPVCSPTRASLLTGRNPHSVGMGSIADLPNGFANALGFVPKSAATMGDILRCSGYTTFAVGKWHLSPLRHDHGAGPFQHWPLGSGFDRFYGFLGGLTDHWNPDLVEDNHRVERPHRDGYHLSEDLVDRAIQMVASQKSAAPSRPFFLYLAFGAGHSPHQAPAEYIDRYAGRFDDGWDALRERWYERQLEMGVIPEGTVLPPPNEDVRRWDTLSADDKRLFARMQEVYAGFLTHTDAQIGRLTDFLQRIGQLENTLLVFLSDNGAAAAGGHTGTDNNLRQQNNLPEELDRLRSHIDELGSATTSPIYPRGWAMAGNSPLKLYKQNTHGGGVRAPLIIHWPAGATQAGKVRGEFHFVSDILPTVLDCTGATMPDRLNGVAQQPIHGTSLRPTFDDSAVGDPKTIQYFEFRGHRGLWHDGWKAVTRHEPGADYFEESWELYKLDEDFSESHDLAKVRPEVLDRLKERWWVEAGRYGVLPLDDHGRARRLDEPSPWERPIRTIYPESEPLNAQYVMKDTINTSYRISAELIRCLPTDEGVLLAMGGRFGGMALYVKDGYPIFEYNFVGEHFLVQASRKLDAEIGLIACEFHRKGDSGGDCVLRVDEVVVGEGRIPNTLPLYLGPEPLEVGRDTQTPVSNAYACPFEFTGTIHAVTIEILDDRGTGADAQESHSGTMAEGQP